MQTKCGRKELALQRPGDRFSKVPENPFGPEQSFLKLRYAYSNKPIYYDFKIRKGNFVTKFHAWKRLRFQDA